MTGGMGDAAEPGQCDAVLLAPLTEDTFLHNLHVRYKQDVIYVSTSLLALFLIGCSLYSFLVFRVGHAHRKVL